MPEKIRKALLACEQQGVLTLTEDVEVVRAAAGLIHGPAAGNLVGQRRAAQRIAMFSYTGDPLRAERHPAGTDIRPHTVPWASRP